MQATLTKTPTQTNPELPPRPEERGAIVPAFLVWLLGGGLGLAILVYLLLRVL
jgi:hypothetical protein